MSLSKGSSLLQVDRISILFLFNLSPFPFFYHFCTPFSVFLAELFAVLDESERILGEIDGLTKQNQHKVSPWLAFLNTHTDYQRSVHVLK